MICACDIYFVGCFKHCKQITTTPVVAQMTGTHAFVFHYNGAAYCRNIIGIEGAPFLIPNQYNETATIIFQATNPDGSPLTYNEYTCFQFKNQLGFDVDCETETDLCQNTCEDQCP